jgi:hypothetical protein
VIFWFPINIVEDVYSRTRSKTVMVVVFVEMCTVVLKRSARIAVLPYHIGCFPSNLAYPTPISLLEEENIQE